MKTLEERFWEKVDVREEDECWPWKACKGKGGYGKFGSGRSKTIAAHRVAYELGNGSIPEGLDVLHKCDFPPCCNPGHLWPGTNLDNQRDCIAKGRTACGERNGTHTHPEARPRGEANGSTKLTETQVREVRRLCNEGHTQRETGELVGVKQTAISQIMCGKTWKNIGL
uniref:Putative homing endonuclease n=1 Tax=viral metagenome TaxID=1070528 RepID=A0A6M3JC30_9ZZZZ